MTKVTGAKKDRMISVMKDAFRINTGTRAKPEFQDTQPSEWYPFSSEKENPYEGVLFIEYRPEATAVLKSSLGNLKGPVATTADVNRNLNESGLGDNPGQITASADVLKN